MRGSYRLRCLKQAFTTKNYRRHLLCGAFLCWTIYENNSDKFGITHVILFPAGNNDHSVEYYDKESAKLITFRNKFIAIGWLGLA